MDEAKALELWMMVKYCNISFHFLKSVIAKFDLQNSGDDLKIVMSAECQSMCTFYVKMLVILALLLII